MLDAQVTCARAQGRVLPLRDHNDNTSTGSRTHPSTENNVLVALRSPASWAVGGGGVVGAGMQRCIREAPPNCLGQNKEARPAQDISPHPHAPFVAGDGRRVPAEDLQPGTAAPLAPRPRRPGRGDERPRRPRAGIIAVPATRGPHRLRPGRAPARPRASGERRGAAPGPQTRQTQTYYL